MTMERYICIHGHFYQPPRENPWLEAVEVQYSAHPYHDWNERVTAECYAPNSASRILDGDDRVMDIISTYARISFNFGPTLLSWMETHAPEIYRAILLADRQSIEWRSGHGNAIAQVYNHMIMPLASGRDKRTQVIWGIRDFESRFGRSPEGMWLSETAVDLETLDIMAEAGIRFTILAPHQAVKVRKIGGRKWKDISGGKIDPTMAYLCRLPSGRKISLFFYDGPISHAVAFEKLLNRGEDFAHRLLGGFSDSRKRTQLVHIATDGETYGHHHKYGEMALAYALNYIERNGLARITNYGEYLEKYPPAQEVRIAENTSWSCFHGVERWRSDCGCNSGGNPGWNQGWRAPLRAALDRLRDRMAEGYARKAGEYLRDPWLARDDYISVVMNRSAENIGNFTDRHALRVICPEEMPEVLGLLEMQRQAMLMYTSCGWFFDEISGLETTQVLQYAGRAIQLAEKLLPGNLEEPFLEILSAAGSNLPQHENGRRIYENSVKPYMIDLVNVGAHYAVSSIFEDYPDETGIYCFRIGREEFRMLRSGQSVLAVGKIYIRSAITLESVYISFCAVFFGNHAVYGGVRSYFGVQAYEDMKNGVMKTFADGDLAEIIRLMDRHFGMHNYSVRDLFRDEQRKILGLMIDKTLTDFDSQYTTLYENSRGLMGMLRDSGMPIPPRLFATAEIALNLELRNSLAVERVDVDVAGRILEEMRSWNVRLDSEDLEFLVRRKIEGMMDELRGNSGNTEHLEELRRLMDFVAQIAVELNCWKVQNTWFEMAKTEYPRYFACLRAGEEDGARWVEEFEKLGELLGFNIRAVIPGS
jgi:alpha-amylase/alpha-mannosidase (GH57 family)